MPAAPVIGVTTYPPLPEAPDRRFHLPVAYVEALRRAGAVPVLVPPGEGELATLLERLDALLLTGGGDVAPERYGGRAHPTIERVDRARDESELALVHAAVERGLPTLGICRGCQVVNVALGGSLVEHLPDEVGERVPHRSAPGQRSFHGVSIEPGSRLSEIVGQREPAPSSSHHQAIRRVGQGLTVTARAADGTIEAVELARHPFLVAVQWHPEHTAADDPAQQRLFDALVAAARRR